MSRTSKNILISFVLLIFVGQTAASNAIAYLSQSVDQSSSSNLSVPHVDMHSMHNMADMNDMSMSDSMKDCCTQGSDCSMSGCILMAIPHLPVVSGISIGFQKIVLPQSTIVQYSPSSLFRPPILA